MKIKAREHNGLIQGIWDLMKIYVCVFLQVSCQKTNTTVLEKYLSGLLDIKPDIRTCIIFWLTIPSLASAICFILVNSMAEISSRHSTVASPGLSTRILGMELSLMTLNGQCFLSDWTVASSNLLPIRRLMSNTVFCGFLDACSKNAMQLSRYW